MADTIMVGTHYIVKTPGVISGMPRIANRRIGVHNIVAMHLRLDASLEEVMRAYDVTLAEIHSALAYYYDHSQEIDDYLDEDERYFEEHGPSDEELAARMAEMKARKGKT